MIRHNWANSLAGCKEEIGNVNFIFVIVLGNGFSVLVDEFKIGYFVIFFLVLKRAVHQLGTYHGRLVNR